MAASDGESRALSAHLVRKHTEKLREVCVPSPREPRRSLANLLGTILSDEGASEAIEVSRHRGTIIEVARRDLEHVVALCSELLSDPAISLASGWVAVNVLAESI
jgi:hypothetical protein